MPVHLTTDMLTTRAAAKMLGVGPTSIKRWADEGILDCVKTAGGHRRIPRAAVAEFLRRRDDSPDSPAPGWPPFLSHEWIDRWIQLLIDDPAREANSPVDRLRVERIERGNWADVADAIGTVVTELGRRWQVGSVSVLEEHVASERLERALARACEDTTLPADAPRCLLVTAPGDDHTLGLALAELVLREAGWRGWWAGRRTPIDLVTQAIASGRADMLCLSASVYTTDASLLARLTASLGEACREHGVQLVLGGSGSWPDSPEHGNRLRSFAELARLEA